MEKINGAQLCSGLPRSMPNADQNFGIDPNVDQFLLIPINAGSTRIDPSLVSVNIDRHLS